MWAQVEQALTQSAASVWAGVLGLLPGVIAMGVSLLLAAIIGWIFAVAIRRVLGGIEFDRRMAAWGWSDFAGWTGVKSPTLLLARIAAWTMLALGFLVGLAAFDPTLTSRLAGRLFGSAMNLLTALVILFAGNILARFLSRGVLVSLVNMNVRQARLLSLGVKWLVLILSSAMALDHLSIGGHIVDLAFGILFGGVVLALALAVGLRSKDLAEWSLGKQAEQDQQQRDQPIDHL